MSSDGARMIERVWRGWIALENADAYERFLRDQFLPGAHRIAGYRGARVMRRRVGDEVEYMTITHFDSIDAIRAFAGEDIKLAHIAPEARTLLSRWDERVAHYEHAFDDEVGD
jgi:heme-degrading monooxygenase HmoA